MGVNLCTRKPYWQSCNHHTQLSFDNLVILNEYLAMSGSCQFWKNFHYFERLQKDIKHNVLVRFNLLNVKFKLSIEILIEEKDNTFLIFNF